jgi:serralysin
MKFKFFLSPDAADLPDFSELIGMSQSAGFALSPNVTFAGPDATMGTLQQIADFEITGYWASPPGGGGMPRKWASNTISVNITGLTPAEQILAKDALADWAAVANLKFTETNGPANITYIDTGPGASASPTVGTNVTVNIASDFSKIGPGPDGVGSYLFTTYIHETGHALGLGHTGPYNFGVNLMGVTTPGYSPTYGRDNIFTNDTWQWSVMSYFNQSNFGNSTVSDPVTAQMADILAIQQIYGAPTTSVGNTTYGFNSTAGPIYDFSKYPIGATPPRPRLYDL